MDEKISGISLKTMFQHEGYGCLCAKDTVNTFPDEAPTVTLKVCPDTSTQLLFSYAPKDGLNMTGVAGGLHEKCMWSMHASASSISTFFCLHKVRSISPMSFFNCP